LQIFKKKVEKEILTETTLWPHSFSSSEEPAERFWRQNDVIWQLVKLCFY